MSLAPNTSLPINTQLGLLPGAEPCLSPHADERPEPSDISLLVIHGISLPPGEFGGPYIDQLFLGTLDFEAHPYFAGLRGVRVSAHLLIRRDGSVMQYVPFHRRAWHAGLSRFAGRERCNDYSIGIELEGTDTTAYTEAQYVQLARVAGLLMRAYPGITPGRVAGHDAIAPGRKTDPGASFDWARLRRDLLAYRQPDNSNDAAVAGREP